MSGVHELGAVVVLEGVFTRTDTGAAEDPAAVTVTARSPSGIQTTPAATLVTETPDQPGTWECSLPVDEPGLWQYRVEGTGGITAIAEGALYVRRSAIEGVGT